MTNWFRLVRNFLIGKYEYEDKYFNSEYSYVKRCSAYQLNVD